MARSQAEWYQLGINYYVPRMEAAPGVDPETFLYVAGIGAPAAASATIVFNVKAITNAALTLNAASDPTILPYTLDGTFGRALQLTGGTAGDNAVVTVTGRDYLGQKITQTFTLSGTGAVTGAKAFKYIDSVGIAAGNANATSTLSVGHRAVFGLPFKSNAILAEFADDVLATIGTLTAPVLTDPQTAALGDPRGTVTPNTTPNGAKVLTFLMKASNSVNTTPNGGLHGIKGV